MKRFLAACAALAVLAGSLWAGPKVTITGLVQKADSSTICSALATHRIDCTQVGLFSSTVDLDKWVGHTVTLAGQLVMGNPCVLVEVKEVKPPKATIEICGTPAPGCPVKFKSCPGGLSIHSLFAAAGPGFYPVGLEVGTFLLDPLTTVTLFHIPWTQPGCLSFVVTIPPAPVVVGKTVYLQGARQDFGPVGTFPVLTNPLCVTILPPTVPCEVPDC